MESDIPAKEVKTTEAKNQRRATVVLSAEEIKIQES
jgi:hypothetical protein